jgi:hypothetical protein
MAECFFTNGAGLLNKKNFLNSGINKVFSVKLHLLVDVFGGVNLLKDKNSFFLGFFVYLVLSLLLNLLFVFLFSKQAEHLAVDLLHLIPSLMFNELVESISPSFHDILFLIPIALTDGIIGGFIGLISGGFLRDKSKGTLCISLMVSFAIFEFVVVKFIPIFTS